MSVTTIPLNLLRPGAEAPTGSINVRTTPASGEALASLYESILAHGLIQPIAVAIIEGQYYVAGGNRRLAALKMLASDSEIPEDYPVPAMVLDRGSEALREISLAENFARAPLHPIDQYEAFSQVAEDGKMTPAQVACRFGVSAKQVRRALALGRLAPEIRAAWRDGAISEEIARVFTLEPDLEKQAKAFEKLTKNNQLYAWAIRDALVPRNSSSAVSALRFVGTDAYTAAGGRLIEDLFADNTVILDPDLAIRLSEEKLDGMRHALVEEDGWSFAADIYSIRRGSEPTDVRPLELEEPEDSETADATFERYRAALREAFTPEERSTYGVALYTDYHGGLAVRGPYLVDAVVPELEGGHIPEISRGTASGASAPEAEAQAAAEEAPRIPASVLEMMSEAQTAKMAELTAKSFDRALVVAIAALASIGSPARLFAKGFNALEAHELLGGGLRYGGFRETLAKVESLTKKERQGIFAYLVAQSLDLRDSRAYEIGSDGIGALLDYGGKTLDSALRKVDLAAYFLAVSKAATLAAIREMLAAGPIKSAGWTGRDRSPEAIERLIRNNGYALLKKPDLADRATRFAAETGWLPQKLRLPEYDGPGAVVEETPALQAAE
jgi:ParB family transcriptional regulator, chromosome partitioning protein